MKCPVCGNDLHSEICQNANGNTLCLFCPAGHFCTDHHANPEQALHEVLSAYLFNVKKEGNWMAESYIKVSDLLEFCRNQADHSITPNDFMRMNFVTKKEPTESGQATLQDENNYDKIMRGLECCNSEKTCHSPCPYSGECSDKGYYYSQAITDAVALLKAQEPKEMHWIHCVGKSNIWYCSNCGEKVSYNNARRVYKKDTKPIEQVNRFCRGCGYKAVKWDGKIETCQT